MEPDVYVAACEVFYFDTSRYDFIVMYRVATRHRHLNWNKEKFVVMIS